MRRIDRQVRFAFAPDLRRVRRAKSDDPKKKPGKRPGPKPGRRPPTPHRARPAHAGWKPVHVTLRARRLLPSLRTQLVLKLLRAIVADPRREAFRVVHWSIQSDHVHLIVEAKDRDTLEWGVRSLVIRLARRLNGLLERRGPVWGDRYHRRDVATPAEVRTLLLYVLANARKHERVAHGARWIDPFSSARAFDGWERAFRAEYVETHHAPHTWLLRVGWKRWGPLRFDEAPRA